MSRRLRDLALVSNRALCQEVSCHAPGLIKLFSPCIHHWSSSIRHKIDFLEAGLVLMLCDEMAAVFNGAITGSLHEPTAAPLSITSISVPHYRKQVPVGSEACLVQTHECSFIAKHPSGQMVRSKSDL